MFIRKQSEQITLLTLSPTERYLKLIKEYEKDINSNNDEMAKFIEEYKKSIESKIDKEARTVLKKELKQQLLSNAVSQLQEKNQKKN